MSTDRRAELERAALAAAEQWYSDGRAGHRLPSVRLTKAIEALIFDCPECNAGGHTCPGCGASVAHYGPRACSDCDEVVAWDRAVAASHAPWTRPDACPKCGGLGVEQHIDADLIIPDKDATLRKGAIAPWAKSSSPYYLQTLESLGKHYKFAPDSRWKELPKKTQDAILYGSGDDDIKFSYDDGMRAYQTKKPFEGVITNLERRWKETESDWAREELQKYFTDVPCDASPSRT